AKKVIAARFAPDLEILPFVESIGTIRAKVDPATVTRDMIESNIVRTGDPDSIEPMIDLIKRVRGEGNSVGGVVVCLIRNVPVGLVRPDFDRLEAALAKAMLSLAATKGFEIGCGFAGTEMTGREHTDAFRMEDGRVRTTSNRSGGV